MKKSMTKIKQKLKLKHKTTGEEFDPPPSYVVFRKMYFLKRGSNLGFL